jgi:hypothetical protein
MAFTEFAAWSILLDSRRFQVFPRPFYCLQVKEEMSSAQDARHAKHEEAIC